MTTRGKKSERREFLKSLAKENKTCDAETMEKVWDEVLKRLIEDEKIVEGGEKGDLSKAKKQLKLMLEDQKTMMLRKERK